MCCLFGLIDVSRGFTAKEKSRILNVLGTACEKRGVDATGIAYNAAGRLSVYKRPLPAHSMNMKIPAEAKVIMGHTRMTTQGSADKRRNNHPFIGKVDDGTFALAHNGILYNDKELRLELNLPQTKIETDSYVAVQLIEQKRTLQADSLRYMAELLEGPFTFTVLDEKDTLYIVKGENPFCLYWFDAGFYLYASTAEILNAALKTLGMQKLEHQRVSVEEGEILRINSTGKVKRDTFKMPERYSYWGYPSIWAPKPKVSDNHTDYHRELIRFGEELGIPTYELQFLERLELTDMDLENVILDNDFRRELLFAAGYYDEGVWESESACYYAW